MKPDALAVANYLLDLADEQHQDMQPLKLMKLVYISHGFMLSLLGRSALNERFDRVEAWRYGPVIPSVYHSFKIYGNNKITEKTTIFREVDDSGNFDIVEPQLHDQELKDACRAAFQRFGGFTGAKLVKMLHGEGTPWEVYYEEGKNNIIPDSSTRRYYDVLIDYLLKNQRERNVLKQKTQ